jgi:N-hydroxyarylamine O-acetyltransferase
MSLLEPRMSLDIDAYGRRIGYAGPREPTLDVLRALHRLHPAAIPFENLTTLLGRTPALDLASLEEKLVRGGRGGYCFEQNGLFAGVLETLGFEVTALAARVLWERPPGAVPPRTHMLLAVRVEGETYVADVGFGGLTLTAPLRLEPRLEQETPHERFRLVPADGGFVLEAELETELGACWRPLYWFDLHEQLAVDFGVLNHFVATHPGSPFPGTLMAARVLADRRLALRDNRLSMRGLGGETSQRVLESAHELRGVLTRDFGIALPADAAIEGVLARAVTPGGGDTPPVST